MPRFRIAIVALIALPSLIPCTTFAQTNDPPRKPVTVSTLPVTFEPNQGQASSPVRFIARASNVTLDLLPSSLDFSFTASNRATDNLSIQLVHSSKDSLISPSDLMTGESNYFLGRDPSLWRTHIPNYASVRYVAIYPGIDLKVYGSDQKFEHDFVVAPGASSGQIRMKLDGARKVSLAPDGGVRIALRNGVLILHRPRVYQQSARGREPRHGRFVLLAKDELAFAIGPYDHQRDLIIDPVLSYSTYVATAMFYFGAFTADSVGNAYIAGLSFGGFPVTPAAFQPTCASCANQLPDVVVTKLSPDGTSAVFSTYLGGNSYDQAFGVAVDSHGNVLVSGYTQSPDFPVKNPISPGNPGNGPQWAFITSFSPDGSSLNYSSILGGNSTYEFGVALDTNDSAYISGITDTTGFPVTSGALDNTSQSTAQGVYVAKFLADGTLGYSAIVGDPTALTGDGLIGSTAIAVDLQGSAYITGTAGSSWPTTSGAYQTTIPGGGTSNAPFVTKLAADGSSLAYSTFIANQAEPSSIAVNSSGEAFFAGYNATSTYPTTSNAFQASIPANSCCPAFFSELNSTGSQLAYSSFFFGNLSTVMGSTTIMSIALDSSSNIWLAGYSADPQLPLVHPIQSVPAFSISGSAVQSGFLTEFNAAGTTPLFSSYFAGPSTGSEVFGLAFDSAGNVHLGGQTGSDLYTTPGAYVPTVPTPGSGIDNFLFGFAASIDTNTTSPLLCISYPESAGLSFVADLGAAATQSLTISNCGSSSLTIASVQSSLALFTIPAAKNGCTQPISSGDSCTLSVVFTPTAFGGFQSILNIQSNATFPVTELLLTGDGLIGDVSVQPLSLAFGPTPVGQTSAGQSVVVMNTGTTSFAVDLSQTSIASNFNFAQSGCNVALSPGQSCSFSVTFNPASTGTLSGGFSIITNDPVNPQVIVALSGTAIKPSFSFGSGGTSQTVAQGATATYSLSLVATADYSGTVTLTCSQVPSNASCNINPAQIPLSSGQTVNLMVMVATQGSTGIISRYTRPWPPLRLIIILLSATVGVSLSRRALCAARLGALRAPVFALSALAVAVILFGCGGGGGAGSTPAPPAQTPPGTYTLTLSASDGTNTQSESLTLIVQ
jgi:hypothetical protein